MTQVNPTLSPNQFGANTGGGTSIVDSNGAVGSKSVVEALAKILENQNRNFDSKLQAAEGASGAQQGGGTGSTQGNTSMLEAQQAAGEVNTTQSIATSVMQGLTDAQKETARASH